jgi:outer membrane protein
MIADLRVLIRYLGAFIEKSLPDRSSSLNIAALNPGVMNKIFISAAFFILLSLSANAQDKWDLERCIREALINNLTNEQIKLNKEGYDISGKQLRRERIPSLNVSSDFGFTVGRVINPATNNFETENSLYQSMGLGTGLTLYSGGRISKSVKQNDIYVAAAELDIRQAQEDLSLNVANTYLSLLFSYENLEIAKNRVKLTQGQLDNMEKLIEAGTKPEIDKYDILSQLAVDEQGLITAQNNIEIYLLTLRQQMLMEPDYPLDIDRPQLNYDALEPLENQPFDSVYAIALKNQAQIQAAELRQEANEIGVGIARSFRIPSLSIGGNLGTNWSNLAKTPGSFDLQRIQQPGVYINGDPAQFEYDSYVPGNYESIPYSRQLDQNIGYGWGATLSIPILNNYSAQANVEKAKISVINADIETEKLKQTLKTNVQNALTSAKAARKSMEGAEAAAYAARISLQNADRKAALGTINNFEYLSARNRSDIAENNLLISKYDYYFQIKVIEYYMGRGIRLD